MKRNRPIDWQPNNKHQVFQSMSYNEISIAARAASYSEFAVAPPVYSEIAVAPPAYSEAPHDDLAAELAQMKAMMEQMRLEKERMETEAKRKAEEEAVSATKVRAEQEEMREFSEIYKKLHEKNEGSWLSRISHGHKVLLTSLSQREVVLFGSNGGSNHTYFITNKNVFRVYPCPPTGPILCAVYTFNSALTKQQIIMLEKGVATDLYGIGSSSIIDRMSDYQKDSELKRMTASKKFESVIRLIPGSYQNGDWRQLDGFFGMYFNETTMEVSEVPPPSI